ncbi:MAG TPA: ParA family protein [Rectinemataceae bacterium]|nr:ParA family protein [Rectinemataceae bacterium]
MKVLCIAQQKGGVCKTTTALSLSAAWALEGARVLMVDVDPQANLTRNILDYERLEADISQIYAGKLRLKDAIAPTTTAGLFIVPARTALNRVENLERSLSTYTTLRREVPKLGRSYDYVVIDTPPSLGLFTVSALLAATHVLVPVQPTFFCQEGLGDLNQTIVEARENNSNLASVRYFMTLFDKRTVISQELAELLRERLGKALLAATIRKNIAVEESQYAQKTIFEYAPKSPGAEDYRALAKEVAAWLANA